ncbi:MAG: FAD-binding oxidoreductase [Acetobacteraceae bacterium]
MPDVVVIGAGISGAAAAYELARDGLDVVLLDRYGPAAMASGWTLAGVRQSGRHPAELPLARAAVAEWETLAARLDGRTEYRRHGNLRLARNEPEVAVIRRLVDEQSAAGLDIAFLPDAASVRTVAPAISPRVLAASFCPSDGHADPHATVNSFVAAAERRGVRLRFGERVRAIETANGRVIGVVTDAGRIAAPRVVLAAGVFANELLDPLGLAIPLTVPMVTVLRSAPGATVLEQVIGVANADCAGRQEADGRFRVTSGLAPWHQEIVEGATPAIHPGAASIAETVTLFSEVVPAFGDARIKAIWAGLIDLTPDALPVLDAPEAVAGLVIGAGFSGHGFCLGPVTGRILADLAQDRAPVLPISPFRLARFAGWNAPAEPPSLHG